MTAEELLPIDAYLSQFIYAAPERIVGAARFVSQLRAEVERLQPFEQDADDLAEALEYWREMDDGLCDDPMCESVACQQSRSALAKHKKLKGE